MDAVFSLASSSLLLLVCLPPSALPEVFTSVAGVEKALREGLSLVAELRQHARHGTPGGSRRAEAFKRIADSLEENSLMYLERTDNRFLHHPVNNYLVIKDLVSHWRQARTLILEEEGGPNLVDSLGSILRSYPVETDVRGAALGLLRLQETYDLSVSDMLLGNLPGNMGQTLSLSVNDCFDIGSVAYEHKKYFQSTLWLYEVMQQLQKGGTVGRPIGHEETENPASTSCDTSRTPGEELKPMAQVINQGMLFKYLADSLYLQGHTAEALSLTKAWVVACPSHAEAKSAHKYYKRRLKQERLQLSGRVKPSEDAAAKSYKPGQIYGENRDVTEAFDGVTLTDFAEAQDRSEVIEERQTYEELCRGGLSGRAPLVSQVSSQTCRFRCHPDWFILAPLKEETISSANPPILLYHNALSGSEVLAIRLTAEPHLGTSLVYSSETFSRSAERTSKSAWLSDTDHPLIAKSSYKMAAIANLSTTTAEDLQVLNYGIGGHYNPHFDFVEDSASLWDTGNRLATVLCYLSDVPSGGATVFTEVGVTVQPEEGACVLWFNLRRSGSKDYRSRHAACPVIVGSKWVANKWFHEVGQELHRPCALLPDD